MSEPTVTELIQSSIPRARVESTAAGYTALHRGTAEERKSVKVSF